MIEWIKNINWKYVIVMCIGNIILGLGIAIFKFSGLGNDPFSGMVMALSDRAGIEYAVFLIMINTIVFIVEFILGRKLIGLGTFVNALLLGYVVTFFYNLIVSAAGEPGQLLQRILIVCIGRCISCRNRALHLMTVCH